MKLVASDGETVTVELTRSELAHLSGVVTEVTVGAMLIPEEHWIEVAVGCSRDEAIKSLKVPLADIVRSSRR